MNAEHDIKRLSDDELKQRWKYQQSPGPHTMGIGTCRVCGGDSRGGEWRNTSRGWYGQPEDGAIPPIADVTPEFYPEDESVYVHLDTRHLSTLAEALGAARLSLCIHKGGKKPILVQPLKWHDSIGVLMPTALADESRAEAASRWSDVRAKVLAGVAEPAKETP